MKTRTILAQLRTSHSRIHGQYTKRIELTACNHCHNCGHSPYDTHHLFDCPSKPTTLTVQSLWTAPTATAKHLNLTIDETSQQQKLKHNRREQKTSPTLHETLLEATLLPVRQVHTFTIMSCCDPMETRYFMLGEKAYNTQNASHNATRSILALNLKMKSMYTHPNNNIMRKIM